MPGTECDVAGYQECMKNTYLPEHQVPPPSDSLEKLSTLQEIRCEMMQCFSQLVFCSVGFLVVTKASAKDLLDVPKEPEQKLKSQGHASLGVIFSCELCSIFLFLLRIFCTFCHP